LRDNELINLAKPLIREAAAGHFGSGDRTPGQEPAEQSAARFRELVDAIEVLAEAAAAPKEGGGEEEGHPHAAATPPDAARLARWLDLIEGAAFLGRGEEP
jgi:hypothetical protein